jgi:putative hydrolase of the HAD superfamily
LYKGSGALAVKSRVIFFDLDDTLYPAEEIYQKGLKAAWRCLSTIHPISWKNFLQNYARARREVKSRLGNVASAHNRILYLKQLVEILYGQSRPATILELMRAYNTCWSLIRPASTRRLAQRLSSQYELGVVTNQVTGFQLEKMRRIDPLGRWFKILVTSEEVGCEKPDRRFFKEACRVAKCRPSEAIVVGDSWHGDILGARRAGLQAIYVASGPLSKKLPTGVRHARSLAGIEAAIQELSQS